MGTIVQKIGKSFQCDLEIFPSRNWKHLPVRMGNIYQYEKCFQIHMGNMSHSYCEIFPIPTGKLYAIELDNMALWEVEMLEL